jgi:threonine aldolase
MQLASKMRFISSQYIGYFRDDLWKRSASHSNSMARIFADKLREVKGIRITQEVQSNGIFVIMPKNVAERIRLEYFFYPWNEQTSEYRLMTSWDTTEEDIDNFIDLLKVEMKN